MISTEVRRSAEIAKRALERGKLLLVDAETAEKLKPEPDMLALKVDMLQHAVCSKLNIDMKQHRSKKRSKSVAESRQIVVTMLWWHTEMSMTEIGEIYGQTHGSVSHSRDVITCKYFDEPKMREVVHSLERFTFDIYNHGRVDRIRNDKRRVSTRTPDIRSRLWSKRQRAIESAGLSKD